MKTQTDHAYSIEVTAILVAGLGTLMLIVLSAWGVAYFSIGQQTAASEELGDGISTISDSSQRFGYLQSIQSSSAQVAGVTDSASPEENTERNNAANWLVDVRERQNLEVAYRDGVLDRNAQNHARTLADLCDITRYNDWSDMLQTTIDEGFIIEFSEAAFAVNGRDYLAQFPAETIPYSRLFTNYQAFGVGYANVETGTNCDPGAIVVYHLASVQ